MTACAPPIENCAPPSEDSAPKKLTGSGLLECKSGPNWCFLWTDIGFHDVFGKKTFFFVLETTYFRPEKPLEFPNFGRKIPCDFSEDLFFLRSPVFGRKIPLNLWSSPCSFDPDWDKFLVPPCPSRIHINKPLVPHKIYFCRPSHAILAPGLPIRLAPVNNPPDYGPDYTLANLLWSSFEFMWSQNSTSACTASNTDRGDIVPLPPSFWAMAQFKKCVKKVKIAQLHYHKACTDCTWERLT